MLSAEVGGLSGDVLKYCCLRRRLCGFGMQSHCILGFVSFSFVNYTGLSNGFRNGENGFSLWYDRGDNEMHKYNVVMICRLQRSVSSQANDGLCIDLWDLIDHRG